MPAGTRLGWNTLAQPSSHASRVLAKAGNPRLHYPVVMFPGEEASVSLSEHGPCQVTQGSPTVPTWCSLSSFWPETQG